MGGKPRLKLAKPPDQLHDDHAVNIRAASPRKGRPLRKHAKRAVKLLQRPYGPPHGIRVSEYRKDPVCFLSTTNYKVAARIAPSPDSATGTVTVFDTGAGPNLIRADCVEREVLNRLRSAHEFANISSASRHRLEILGIATLSVSVGEHSVRQPFLVSKNLNADAILGTTYIDANVEYIAPRKQVTVLRDGSVVKIQKRGASTPTTEKTKENILPEPMVTNRVRTTRRISLPPHSEYNVEATTPFNGTAVLVPRPELYDKYRLVMANGLVHTKPNVPFIIRVANMSDTPRTLSKNQVLGLAELAPATVLTITFPDDDHHGPTSTMTKTESQGPENSNSSTDPTVDNINLSHVQPEMQPRVRTLLKKYEGLFDGTLGEINITEHRIQLKDDAAPVHAQPYRAGPSAREFEHTEIKKMLDQKVIEPAQSEWASPVVIAPKKDGSLRFCVDHRKLNDLTVKDSYPLRRMDECLNTLGNAKVFTTLDANSGYWQVPVAEEDRPKTAFTCHAGCYKYRRMPFGLCNAPATFQRTVDIILSQYRWQSCLVYI